MQPIQAFDPYQRNILGQAVHDNILFYDPVEGAYGMQGKSLEWGIKEYFESKNRSRKSATYEE